MKKFFIGAVIYVVLWNVVDWWLPTLLLLILLLFRVVRFLCKDTPIIGATDAYLDQDETLQSQYDRTMEDDYYDE
jgi:hypothetical protein